MSKFFILTRINHTFRRIKLFKIIFGTSFGWRVVLFAVVITLIFFNLTTVSILSTRGYQLKSLDKRIETLKKENQKLQLEVSNYSSPQLLEESAKNLGMVVAKEVHYLSPTTGILVAR